MILLKRFLTAVVLVAALAAESRAQVGRIPGQSRIGVLLDGSSESSRAVLAKFQKEIAEFFGGDQTIEFPPGATLTGEWTVASVRTAADRLLADPGVDIVLALGPIGSNEIARRPTLPKPAIAALVVDATLQNLPLQNGSSGVKNLSYINVAYTATRTLQLFHELIPFHKLAVLSHPGLLAAIPELNTLARTRAREMGISITLVPVTSSAAEALRAIPADAEAVYLAPLEELSERGLDSLISGLNVRRLPTFSYIGRAEVERGALLSFAPQDDVSRRARRVAGNIQRIQRGENAGGLPVALASISSLTLNMGTARAIGYSPDWNTLTEAELLNDVQPPPAANWTLAAGVREAVRVNLNLLASERAVAAGAQEVRIARAGLLPQVQASATGTMIREATAAASLGQQAERQGEAQLGLSQSIISDEGWARLAIQRHLQGGREADRRRLELDIALDAATSYLNVLRAEAVATIERANVKVSRSNLEIAQLRERTGAASPADVYRWQSELAQGRRSVLSADARVHIARVAFNQLLNRPLEESFHAEEAAADDSLLLIGDPRILPYVGDPATFAVFRDFMVAEGLKASPELQTIDAAMAAERRSGTAARRSFWLPAVTLQGGVKDVFARGGTGSTPPTLGPITIKPPPSSTWSLSLQASLPLFTGFARGSVRDQSDIEVARLTLERRAIEQSVSSQIRSALHQAGASWPAIEQARIAAVAARKNLEIVLDGYSRGAVAIVTLLDAQQAALTANETAANAAYDFLVDLMRVERAIGRFDFFRPPEEREAFYQRLVEFYRAAGVAPARR